MADRPCQCGTSNAIDARFCSSCGVALGDQSGLLGVSSTVTNVTTTGGVDRQWMAIAAVVFAAVIGWSISSGGSSDAPSADGAANESDDDSASPTTTAASTPTTRPTTTTQRRPPTTGGLGPTVLVIGTGEPLLGEITGLRLIIGRSADGPWVLDLDAAELVISPGGLGDMEPIMVSGGWLVARRDDRPVAVPTLDLGADPTTLLPDAMGWIEVADTALRADGLTWVYAYDESPRLALVDLATGAAVDFAPEEVDLVSGPRWVPAGSTSIPDLVNHQGGGIYEVTNEGFERVADGLVVVADDRRVLVETCDDRFRCHRNWLDRRTWEPIELAMPPTDTDRVGFVNGTDWLVLTRFWVNDAPTELFNVATGRGRELSPDQYVPYTNPQPAVSPDGRWLALATGPGLTIVNLDTGIEYVIEGVNASYSPLIFTTDDAGYSSTSSNVKTE